DDRGEAHESLNHYSKGSVIRFLHSHTLGLQQDPASVAWESFTFAPVPHDSLTWAEGTHDSPQGTIGASWRTVGEQLHAELRIPAGSRATVALPGLEPEPVLGPATIKRVGPRSPRAAFD